MRATSGSRHSGAARLAIDGRRSTRSRSTSPSLHLDELAARAERSYPAYLLGDPDVWHQVERERDANLSLSAEEEQVLCACSRRGTAEASPLPAFLNGRAGSGKSTLLLY